MSKHYQKAIVHASPEFPCIHCHKPDWCYSFHDLTVCNRLHEPAPGWRITSKTDKAGKPYYAPDRLKTYSKKQTKYWEYLDLEGNKIARAVRIDKGDGSKPFRPQHGWNGKSWDKNLENVNREDIPVYKYPEIRAAIAKGETIFIVEGEKCADAMWSIGLAATTNIGGGLKWRSSDTKCLEGAAEVVICPDRDKLGIQHGLRVSEEFPDALWLYAPPSQYFWLSDNVPESKGLDVADWIESGADKESVKLQITNLSPGKFSESLPLHEKPDPSEPVESREVIAEVEEIYTQKAVDCLYSDSAYLAIHDKIYRYNGTHYKLCSTPREKRRILEWCKTTPVQVGHKWKYALAKPEAVEKIWRWVLTSFSVDSEDINPPGINCLNGVICIEWQNRKVTHKLVPHSPDFYYTHVANFEYDPQADDRDCDRLLAALNPAQQTVFLKTIAASLDLTTVRKYQGRAVKALLCTGTGSNGKDTLREAVRCILGSSMSSASVSDFQQYDQGRKFPLVKIEHASINWSSENSEFARIDSLQGLKAAITGETIDIEPKNATEYTVEPRTVFLFNCNSAPLLQGGNEAIASRWAVMDFAKTFKINADVANGELEADSRFRYDPEFLEQSVCPALLNKILEQLQAVVLEGIDYSALDDALQKVQEDSNHLWQFIHEKKIKKSFGDRLYVSDLWRSLEQWYVANGTLEFERIGDRLKKIWHDQPRKSDRNVTASNQVSKRFKELFPGIEKQRHTETYNSDRKGQFYLSGLKMCGEANGEAETTAYQHGEDGEAKVATLARLVTEIKLLPTPERLTAIKIMNEFIESEAEVTNFASPSSPQDYVRDSASPLASPLENKRSPEQSTNSNEQNSNSYSNSAAEANIVFTVNNNGTSPNCESSNGSSNSVTINDRIIEWVRDKAGIVWQVDEQHEDLLEGHRSGLRGRHKIRYEDVAEFHYAKKPEESEV